MLGCYVLVVSGSVARRLFVCLIVWGCFGLWSLWLRFSVFWVFRFWVFMYGVVLPLFSWFSGVLIVVCLFVLLLAPR